MNRDVFSVLPDPALRAAFAARYPNERTADLAQAFGITTAQAYNIADKMGVKKTPAYLAGPHAQHLRRGNQIGKESRFKPGRAAWNKGMKGLYLGGKATQFKPGHPSGHAAHLVMPIGSYRINAGGYLDQKISDQPGPQNHLWRAVHRLVWEATHGPVPAGHVVIFKAGRRTTDLAGITLEAIELITRAELMRRNTVHRLPPEIKEVTMLRGQIRATLTKRRKKEEKAHASA